MLSMKSSTSWFRSSRKYSVIARPASATRRRAPGRLVHLAVDQRDLRRAEVVLVDDARRRHLVIEVVPLARALADAREHRHAAVELRDVVDQLHDDDGLAHAGAAERADLAPLEERADQVDDLDAGRQHLRRGRLLLERRRRAVNRVVLVGDHRPAIVHRLAGDVEHASHDAVADRHRDRRAGVGDLVAALEPLGAGHRDGAHPLVAEVLLHFQRQRDRLPLDLVVHLQRVVDRRQPVGKLDVHHRAHDLNDFADIHVSPPARRQFPAVPW